MLTMTTIAINLDIHRQNLNAVKSSLKVLQFKNERIIKTLNFLSFWQGSW